MAFPRIAAALIFLSASPAPLLAQQDTSNFDGASILRELDSMEQQQKQGIQSAKLSMQRQIEAAAANPQAAVDLYVRAVEEVDFKGRKDKASAFADWKKDHTDLLRSKEMQEALRLHLRYLALSIKRKDMEKPEGMIPDLLAYTHDLSAANGLFSRQENRSQEQSALMEKTIGESIFSRWLTLQSWFPEEKEWEQKPGDLGGILNKDLRPLMRQAKDARLLETWDFQIKEEADRITQGRKEHDAVQFNAVMRPQLLFNRAQDTAFLGMPNKAAVEIYALVKSHPQHPDYGQWINKLRELIPKPTPAPAPKAPDTSPQ